MDRVRFGRALGYGARHAARAFSEAARAASTPSPAERSAAAEEKPGTRPRPGLQAAETIQQAGASVLEAQRALTHARERTRAGARDAGRSMLAPVKKAGSVLWLEMTGSVFALFALFLAPGVWKLRAALHAPYNSAEAHRFYLYSLMLALFTYFAVSSFVRAHRRGQRP